MTKRTLSDYTMLVMLLVCAITTLIMLSGCASQLQAVSAFNTSGMVSARSAADIAASDAQIAFCAMSVDTLSRHPEYVSSVTDLCLKNSSITAAAAIKANVVAPTSPSLDPTPK